MAAQSMRVNQTVTALSQQWSRSIDVMDCKSHSPRGLAEAHQGHTLSHLGYESVKSSSTAATPLKSWWFVPESKEDVIMSYDSRIDEIHSGVNSVYLPSHYSNQSSVLPHDGAMVSDIQQKPSLLLSLEALLGKSLNLFSCQVERQSFSVLCISHVTARNAPAQPGEHL
jgi:hypothetical protein